MSVESTRRLNSAIWPEILRAMPNMRPILPTLPFKAGTSISSCSLASSYTVRSGIKSRVPPCHGNNPMLDCSLSILWAKYSRLDLLLSVDVKKKASEDPGPPRDYLICLRRYTDSDSRGPDLKIDFVFLLYTRVAIAIEFTAA